jgi:DNA-binding LacI/PurR family transcriptional regulator
VPHSLLSPEEIIVDIKERISRGELQVGAKLPTSRELCQIYKIAPNTLSRCIRRLKENGFVSTKVGDGIYVTDPEGSTTARLQREHFKTTSFVFRIHSTGDANSDQYLSHVYDQAILGIQDQSMETGVASGAVICPDSLVKDKVSLVEFVVRHSATADGVYFIGVVENLSDLLAKAVRKPSIFLLSGQHSLHQHNVFTVDRYLAACTIMRYLFDKGHRRIACLGGPLLGKKTHDNAYGGRVRAWSDIMCEYGQHLAPSLLFACTENVDDITRAAEAIVGLSAEKRPDAVFCFNDMRAMILLRVAERAGLRIPENLAIAGFDGNREAVEAGITTIELPFYLNGRNAATGMRLLLKGEIPPPISSSISCGVKVGRTA